MDHNPIPNSLDPAISAPSTKLRESLGSSRHRVKRMPRGMVETVPIPPLHPARCPFPLLASGVSAHARHRPPDTTGEIRTSLLDVDSGDLGRELARCHGCKTSFPQFDLRAASLSVWG